MCINTIWYGYQTQSLCTLHNNVRRIINRVLSYTHQYIGIFNRDPFRHQISSFITIRHPSSFIFHTPSSSFLVLYHPSSFLILPHPSSFFLVHHHPSSSKIILPHPCMLWCCCGAVPVKCYMPVMYGMNLTRGSDGCAVRGPTTCYSLFWCSGL